MNTFALWLTRLRRNLKYRGLLETIRRYGVLSPVIVLQDGTVIDGNNRVTAAKELGINLPIVRVSGVIEQVDPHTLKLSFPVDIDELRDMAK